MDTNFKFSNLIGSVYRNGNVLFSPDGYSVYSPIGNKVSVFDLKNNVSRTIALESEYNIVSMALNAQGSHLIVTNEAGHVMYVNMSSEMCVHTFRAAKLVKRVEFSPDGKHVAICRDNELQLHALATSVAQVFRPFHLEQTIRGATDTLTALSWSGDSQLVMTGSEDKIVRVMAARGARNARLKTLGGHKGAVLCAQFMHNSYDVVSVCRRGHAFYWTSNLVPGDLIAGEFDTELLKNFDDVDAKEQVLAYEKTTRVNLCESSGGGKQVDVTACRLHGKSQLLVTAFANGVFVLHELPTFALIHNLRVSELQVNTIDISAGGDWLAIGCGKGSSAQLVVWEWQSETYVMKQQSHSQRARCARYSPDGAHLATGAEDGKVKIWSSRNAFCTVTFDEHTSAVTAVAWTQSGRAILSASMDGTVRAHDLKRYRNFRTLVCPEPTQLGSLAVDASGDIVVAAGIEIFQVYIWSMESGRLLDVLSGHTAPVSGLAIHNNTLVTSSWDKTFRVWNIVDSSSETNDMPQEVLNVALSPCGQVIAALTMDSCITLFHTQSMAQLGSIDARWDVDPSRGEMDEIKRDTSAKSKAFNQLCFSPDGALLLVGGESNYFCLYSVDDRLLMNKFKITVNRSLDGVVLDIRKRDMSEFGNLKLIDCSDSEDDGMGTNKKALKLPGTLQSDAAERSHKPIINVYGVTFCPTGRRLAVCSTEGVGVYSLDTVGIFDPFQLDSASSPQMVAKYLQAGDSSSALLASLRLNDSKLIAKSLKATDTDTIPLVVGAMPLIYAEKLLKWMSDSDAVVANNDPHFYMMWLRCVLQVHAQKLKGRTDVAILTGAQQTIAHLRGLIGKLADENKYGLRYLVAARRLKADKDEEMEE